MYFLSAQKQPKLLPPDEFSGLKIYRNWVCGRGSATDPLGELLSLPRPLAKFEGREEREWEEGRI